MKKGLGRLRQWYKTIPTLLTLGNSLCGLTAILCLFKAFSREPGQEVAQLVAASAWLIVFAMLFDMLDGWAARVLRAQSEQGLEMDSLADMVTFGVAPAVMVAMTAKQAPGGFLPFAVPYHVIWVLSAIFMACVTLRLALYNVLARMPGRHDEFRGLPSPGGAAGVASLMILTSKSELGFQVMSELLPFYAGVLGLLMVSRIPYGHFGHWLGNRRRYKLKILTVIIFFVAFSYHPPLVAAIAINGYIISGPASALVRWVLAHRLAAAAPEVAAQSDTREQKIP